MNINYFSLISRIIIKITLFISVFFLIPGPEIFGQVDINKEIKKAEDFFDSRGEVYFKITDCPGNRINYISSIISIDKLLNNQVFAYANENQFREFLKLNIIFEILKPPSFVEHVKMAANTMSVFNWDSYPTYQQYTEMMYDFALNFPSICKIYDIGQSINDKSILFVKISDNVNADEDEPEFMYSSTMHGNEIPGYILMLRLIDYLLNNYNSDPKITTMVNNLEIWINPLANPDGTYYGGDNTVYGAKRYNLNNVDLNRNFPDPDDGSNPDGNERQPENIIMMGFMQNRDFVLSANLHAGAEVINYPWDTWRRLHADDDWFQYISRQYADTVHLYNSTYLDGFDDGITNGYEWYTISGGRQDYVNYFLHGREVTMELSNTKIPAPSTLPNFWEYNYRSLLNYMEQSMFGIEGYITDSIYGNPLKARIEIVGHDIDSSFIYSDSLSGFYHRLIYQGMYDLKISCPDYIEKIIYGVNVYNQQLTKLNIGLAPIIQVFDIEPFPNPIGASGKISVKIPHKTKLQVCVFDIFGNKLHIIASGTYLKGEYTFDFETGSLPKGIYFLQFSFDNRIVRKKIIVLNDL